MAESIKEFGFRQPIVIDENGELIAGHTRLKAAEKLGIDSVPVHIVEDLTAEQIKAYRIADNKTGEILSFELDGINNSKINIELTGFKADELEQFKSGKQSLGWLFLSLKDLKIHPKNYREHTEDQLNHIVSSIEQNGIYKNVVVAKDNTILAGHGVVRAASSMGLRRIPVIRLNINPESTQALKILTGDNEISNLAIIDDRALTEMLKGIKEEDIEGLIGSGFDEQQLALLAMTTRSRNEIKDKNEASEWIGMPDYEPTEKPLKIIVSFRNETDRNQFANILDLNITDQTKSVWYPEKQNNDTSSIIIEEK